MRRNKSYSENLETSNLVNMYCNQRPKRKCTLKTEKHFEDNLKLKTKNEDVIQSIDLIKRNILNQINLMASDIFVDATRKLNNVLSVVPTTHVTPSNMTFNNPEKFIKLVIYSIILY